MNLGLRTLIVFLLTCGLASAADSEPAAHLFQPAAHLGVASCATSVCHGKLTPAKDRGVALNEYRIWTADDRHSKAYQTLLTDDSKRIARNLGLASAQAAAVCLDCHADNVPASLRGPKFQISDGVGCEACHGGAARWIQTHTEAGRSHGDNLAECMYPTDRPAARAQLCLGCHLGSPDRFADHEIMGAGHPRLSFELEAFTANLPPHFIVDADYRARKNPAGAFELWLAGQLQAATAYLELLESSRYPGTGAIPELALHDCHGCHHRLDQRRWNPQRRSAGLKPGSVRLQDQHLLMAESIVAALLPDLREALAVATQRLVLAGVGDVESVAALAGALHAQLDEISLRIQALELSGATATQVRRQLIEFAAAGRMSDFAAAEQTFLAVETLSLYLSDTARLQTALDDLYSTVESDASYDPGRFAAVAQRLRESF